MYFCLHDQITRGTFKEQSNVDVNARVSSNIYFETKRTETSPYSMKIMKFYSSQDVSYKSFILWKLSTKVHTKGWESVLFLSNMMDQMNKTSSLVHVLFEEIRQGQDHRTEDPIFKYFQFTLLWVSWSILMLSHFLYLFCDYFDHYRSRIFRNTSMCIRRLSSRYVDNVLLVLPWSGIPCNLNQRIWDANHWSHETLTESSDDVENSFADFWREKDSGIISNCQQFIFMKGSHYIIFLRIVHIEDSDSFKTSIQNCITLICRFTTVIYADTYIKMLSRALISLYKLR